MIGLAACVPCWVLPLILPNKVCWTPPPTSGPPPHLQHSTAQCSARIGRLCKLSASSLSPVLLAIPVAMLPDLARSADNSVPSAVCCLLCAVRLMQANPGTPGSGSRWDFLTNELSVHTYICMACMWWGRPHHRRTPRLWYSNPYVLLLWLCLQMNVWQAIFGFIGNYFWTHYFFNLLGAAYTLPSHKLNGVSWRMAGVHSCWVRVTPNQSATITAWCPLAA